MDSMFWGSRAPWGRSEDRCDGAGSEADGTKPPVKPGPMLPVLGVLVFEDRSALVKLLSSGLRINRAGRPPGRFGPAFLMDCSIYPIWPAIHTGKLFRKSICPSRSAADFFGALLLRAAGAALTRRFGAAGEHASTGNGLPRKLAANEPSSRRSTRRLDPRRPATIPARPIWYTFPSYRIV